MTPTIPGALRRAICDAALGSPLSTEVQADLNRLGDLAVPPPGHSCPDCARAGILYCLTVAIERTRGRMP